MKNQQLLETGTNPVLNGEDPKDREIFNQIILGFYKGNRRAMPWRDTISPYWVVVSEIMLQQTQVSRVMEKFPPFIQKFPDFSILSSAPLADIFEAWQGLGYNRRAKYLHAIASCVMENYAGVLPQSPDVLETLPGIGKATAGSITVFAFNIPVVFIETNIRRVFIHHFFTGDSPVCDSQILPLVELTLCLKNPREWYYALMDYGAWLAGRTENPNRRSRHYTKQSAFEGSDRQIRGKMIRRLISDKACSSEELIDEADEAGRGRRILSILIQEGLFCETDGMISFSETR